MRLALQLLYLAALPVALLVNPWLLVRLCFPVHDHASRAAVSGACGVALNVAVAVVLHCLKWPITAPVLAAVHGLLALGLAAAFHLRRRRITACPAASPAHAGTGTRLALLLVAFILLVLPFTHLAGIDTYKWQDLATNIRVERNIPWLIHPVSLLGFTPRAYPGAQPILLATVQILGGLGVDGGFFVLSAWFGAIGLFSALVLGGRLFERPDAALRFAAFYVFSPVFMRYNHWATGRGLFLALFPLFLASVAALPRVPAVFAALAAAGLLALSHKVGFVAAALLAASLPLSLALPRGRARWPLRLAFALAAAGAMLIAPGWIMPGPAGRALGCLRLAAARLGFLAPLAALGPLMSPDFLALPSRRRLFPALVIALPLLCEPQMYGALVALPFACLLAAEGYGVLRRRMPFSAPLLAGVTAVLVAAGALSVVVNRSLHATPRAVREAARFLERHDPQGPYRVVAAGLNRARIQAYVSGCPRMALQADPRGRVALAPLPPVRGDPREALKAWIAALRHALSVSDAEIEWYGANPRTYWVVVDGNGSAPPGSRPLFASGGVVVYGDPAETVPPRPP
ncbi:MAG: hypothetical protein FJ225_02610 [Lentisphaerae bacterium]|nr:hypothetical protein [Lentisphaerota bacterium]